jgi:hypothetical protein
MTKFVGKLAKVGIAKETTRGTAVAEGSAKYVKHINANMNDKIDVIMDESSAGVLAKATGSNINQKFAEGSIEALIGDETFGLILLALFGQSPTTTTNADTTKEHDFAFAQNSQHQSMTLFVDDEVQGYRYANGMLASLAIDAELGKHGMFNASFLAKAGEEQSLSPAYASENNFLPGNIEVLIENTEGDLDGATKVCVRSFNISIDKGLEKDQCLGDADINDILNGVVEITGSMELLYQTKDIHDKMMNDDYRAIRIKMENTAVTIGTGSAHPTFEFTLPRVKYLSAEKSYENSSMSTLSVDFEAFYDISAGKIMDAKLVNMEASY